METTLDAATSYRADAARSAQSLSLRDRRQSLMAAAAGNVLEWYDWTIYGILSVYLAKNFFSQSDPTSALLSTLAIFAGGFVARPLGGYIFGRVADGRGRKIALIVTMTMLGLSSLGIALLPTYGAVGWLASLGLMVLRLLQGFAHGGETGVSYVYVAEIAPKQRRGLWSSSVFVSVVIGIMIATGLAAALTSSLSTAEMNDWGWRVGFAVGGLLSLYTLFLRRKAMETEAYAKLQQPSKVRVTHAPMRGSEKVRLCARIIALLAAMNVWYYIWVVFAPALAIASHKMDPSGAYIASLCAQASTLVFLPLFGMLSDRVGRRPVMLAFAVLVILTGVPIQALITSEPLSLFFAQGAGLIVWCLGVSIYPVLMAELVPARARGVGVGIITSLSVAIFGGTAPYLNTWLKSLELGWAFQAYLMLLAAITVVAAWRMPETKDLDLAQ